jgi:hypothetical protein
MAYNNMGVVYNILEKDQKAIKIINLLNKLAKHHGIQQRRTYVKEVKNCRLPYSYCLWSLPLAMTYTSGSCNE